jgi:hypothetical protein
MMFKYTLILLSVFVFSCAKPNYQNSTPPEISDQKQSTGTCPLFFSVERLCADLAWEKTPSETETGSFILKFYVQETPNTFVDPKNSPFVVLWMPSMGHGSSPVTIEKVSEGQYRASKVFFIMPGEWEIRLQLKDGKNVTDQIIKKITI